MVPGPKRAKAVRSIAHVPSGFFWATTVPRPKSRYTRPFVPLAAPKVDCSGSVSMPANAASRTNLPEGASNRARYCSSVPTKNSGVPATSRTCEPPSGNPCATPKRSIVTGGRGSPGAGREVNDTRNRPVPAVPAHSEPSAFSNRLRTSSLIPGTTPSSIHRPSIYAERRHAVEHPHPEAGRVHRRSLRHRRAKRPVTGCTDGASGCAVDLVETFRAGDRQYRTVRARIGASA